jgi:hypothetical protein
MESVRPANEPDVPAGPLGHTGLATQSAPSIDRPELTAPGARRLLHSPIFSILAGIIAPIACFALQPLVFSGEPLTLPGLQFINNFWVFGYGVIGMEMLILTLRLAFGTRLGSWNGPVAGALFAGSLFAGGLGLVLLPFSLIGLFFVVGILGFVPFLTAAVYYTNAVEACRQAPGGMRLAGSALLGALLVISVPVAAQAQVYLTVRSVIRDFAAGNPQALAKLRVWYRFAPRDSLVWSYVAEQDQVRKQRLADAYKELTGEDVESRLAQLSD